MTAEGSLTLGEYLRLERERRGITIEQVASATKINVRMLHSLEADHYADLPAKPFIRGFVTSYVRFVGLNPKETLIRFGDFIDQKAHDRPNRESGHSGYAFEKREGEQSRTLLWFIMGGFIIVAGIGLVFFKPSRHHHGSNQLERLRDAHGVTPSPEPSPEPTTKPSTQPPAAQPPAKPEIPSATPLPSPSPSPSPSPFSSPTPSPTFSPASSPAPSPSHTPHASGDDPLSSGRDLKPDEIKQKSVFKALEDVWVRYQVDDRPKMRIILRAGRVLVLRAVDVIRFQSSKPEAIQFNYNRVGPKPMSTAKSAAMRGKDLTLFFPPEVAKTIGDPFPGEKPMLDREVPAPKATDGSTTPAE